MGSSESCLATKQNFNLVPNLKVFFFPLSTSFCLTEFETCHLTQYWSHHTHKAMMGRPSSLQKCYTLSVSWLALPNLPSLCSECPHHKVQFVPDFKCTWLCESYVCGLHHLSVGKPLGHLWNCFLFVFFESTTGWEKANTLVSKKGSTLRTTWAWQTVFTKRASVHTNLSQCTLLMNINPGVPALLETPLSASSWEPWLFWRTGRQGKSTEE